MPATPLAGRRCEFEIDDGAGPRCGGAERGRPGPALRRRQGRRLRPAHRRHLHQPAPRRALAGARHLVRRRCRLDQRPARRERAGRCQTADASAARGRRRARTAIALEPGMRVVLSARADGPPADYPWLALRAASATASAATARDGDATTPVVVVPLAAARAAPTTPRTAVLTARAVEPLFEITQATAAGTRVRDDPAQRAADHHRPLARPDDRRSTGATKACPGHHVVIDGLDEHAAHGVVEGDNGIEIDGVAPRRRRALPLAARPDDGARRRPAGRAALRPRRSRAAPTTEPKASRHAQPHHAPRARPRGAARATRRAAPARTQAVYADPARRLAVAVATSCGSYHRTQRRRAQPARRQRRGCSSSPTASAAARWRSWRAACWSLICTRAFAASTPDAHSISAAVLGRRPCRSPTPSPASPIARRGDGGRSCAPLDALAATLARRLGRRLPRLSLVAARAGVARAADPRRHLRHLGEAPPAGGSADDPARMVGNGATLGANAAIARAGVRRAARAVQRRRPQAPRRPSTGAVCWPQPVPLAVEAERAGRAGARATAAPTTPPCC